MGGSPPHVPHPHDSVSPVVGLTLASRQSSSLVGAANKLIPRAAAHEFTSLVVGLTPW